MRSHVRRLLLAAGGLVLSLGTAAAQNPFHAPPLGPPAFPKAKADAEVTPAGGCSNCAPAGMVAAPGVPATSPAYAPAQASDLSYHGPRTSRLAAHPLGVGEGCPTGPTCSSYASERTFLWGGCSQFYNPGNKCGTCGPLGQGLGGRLGNKHDIAPFGPGGLGNPNPCAYGSYQNR